MLATPKGRGGPGGGLLGATASPARLLLLLPLALAAFALALQVRLDWGMGGGGAEAFFAAPPRAMSGSLRWKDGGRRRLGLGRRGER